MNANILGENNKVKTMRY